VRTLLGEDEHSVARQEGPTARAGRYKEAARDGASHAANCSPFCAYHGRMRCVSLVLAAVLVAGCGVPEVTFYDAAAPEDAARPDAADGGDARGDAPEDGNATVYCVGPDGGVSPPSLGCCPGLQGVACVGHCMPLACQACQPSCTYPGYVCCTTGSNGICKEAGAWEAGGC
jgi:hypothetical protein